jgi:hypothetical protein
LSNAAIALKSEILLAEKKSAKHIMENSELIAKIKELNSQKEDIAAKLASTTTNYENIRKSYKKLVSSNEEMSLELVSLLSSKVFVIFTH